MLHREPPYSANSWHKSIRARERDVELDAGQDSEGQAMTSTIKARHSQIWLEAPSTSPVWPPRRISATRPSTTAETMALKIRSSETPKGSTSQAIMKVSHRVMPASPLVGLRTEAESPSRRAG